MQLYQVDAFTNIPFAGNPAAVCLLDEPRNAEWMQLLAREMNLSETAFLHRQGDTYNLRWFTPTVEVDLCGHATLASAHVLWESGLMPPDREARFHTRSGLLTARKIGSAIQLDFPATPDQPATLPRKYIEAFGADPLYIGRNEFDYIVELKSEETVRNLAPDLGVLKTLGTRGVMVTSLADNPSYDFVSRFFGPGAGIDEDPVTGSAHCCLGPFWSRRTGKAEFTAYQASERGGVVRVEIAGDRVLLRGEAVTIFQGDLKV